MSTRGWLLIASIAIFGLRPRSAGAQVPPCLRYEPDTVEVAGILRELTFPGPPNYESVRTGDEPQTGLYVRLSRPVCVDSASEVNDRKANIRLVQLLVDSTHYAALRRQVGVTVRLRGTLAGAVWGWHHAPLILRVARPPIRPVRIATGSLTFVGTVKGAIDGGRCAPAL